MNVGTKVSLITFNGSAEPQGEFEEYENYWKLIGFTGAIVQSPLEKSMYASFSEEKRVLVKFNANAQELGLEVHNEIENSLWILESDLEEEGPKRFSHLRRRILNELWK